MKRSRTFRMTIFGCKTGAVPLAWAFGSGLLAGSLVSGGAQAVFADQRLVFAQSAGASALVPTVLPLLISGLAVYAGWPLLLIPAAFWKSFSFSYVALGVILAWGNAGWMVGGLGMFASLCSLSVLWWYWLRHIGGEDFSGSTFSLALGAMLLLSWVDLGLISPFLANILTF